MIEMPPSGRSDNPFEVFRWQERRVPISGYPPKVPFLSLEDAIPFPRKSHRNNWKAVYFCFQFLNIRNPWFCRFEFFARGTSFFYLKMCLFGDYLLYLHPN